MLVDSTSDSSKRSRRASAETYEEVASGTQGYDLYDDPLIGEES